MRPSSPRRSWSLATLLLGTVVSLSCGGDGGSPSPTPTDVLVTPGADTLVSLGETQVFTASVLDANGDPIDAATVAWSSSAPSILSIDATTGLATAHANGAATVTATSGALHGDAPITVAQVPTTVTITPATGVFTFVGDTQTFSAAVLDAGGAPVVPVQKVWTLNDNTVAVIDSTGLARAKGPGLAMVTVVAIGPGGAKAGYAAVNSTQPVASLTFRAQPSGVEAGESMDPAIQAEVRDSGNAVVSGYSGAVTIGVDSGPAGAVLHGTKTVNAVNGVVSYSGLWLDKAGNYRFKVTAASLSPATSSGFAVEHSVSQHVRIITGPDDDSLPLMNAGQQIPLTGVLEDRFDNRTFDSTTPVIVEYLTGPNGGGIVGPDTSVHLGGGLRGFPTSTIVRAGVGHQIRLTGPGILPDSTRPFQVMPAGPALLVILNDPPISAGYVGWGTDSVQFDVVDAFDNPTYVDIPTLVGVTAFGWPYAAPEGRGSVITPSTATEISGGGPFYLAPFGLTRPGPAGFVLEGGGLIPDTAEVTPRRILIRLDVAAGGNTTCAGFQQLLLCTGANDSGMMGVAADTLALDSVLVAPDVPFGGQYLIAVGGHHVCRMMAYGGFKVFCRGSNDEGQLGAVGPGGPAWEQVAGADGAWQLTAGDGHTCALLADSTAVCWGANDRGQLGRGTVTPFETAAGGVSGGLKWKSISAGDRHTCGVTAAGAAYCWGANESGQLGDSTQSDRSLPTALFGGGTWLEMAAGGQFSCGQWHTGYVFRVVCWGDNSLGQVGVAGGGLRLIPTIPDFSPANQPLALVAGHAHACTNIEGSVICWGDNSRGAVGTGSIGGVSLPVVVGVPFSTYVGPLTVGKAHTCVGSVVIGGLEAFDANYLFCWGANDVGQLGDGTTIDRGAPVEMIR